MSGRHVDVLSVLVVDEDLPGPVLDAVDEAGFEVTRYGDPERALDAAGERDPLVTSELDTLRAVRNRSQSTPIVLCAPADGELVREAVAADVTEFVPLDDVDASLADALRRAARPGPEEADDERFREAIESVNPASVIVVDSDGRVVWSNPRARERLGFGYGDKYVVGETDVYDENGAFIPTEDRPYIRVFETGEPVRDWEAQIENEVGLRWVSISAVPITDGDEVTHVAISAEDVTERRQAHAQLEAENRAMSEELDETLRRTSEAFVALDADGDVMYVNDRAESLLDVEESDVVGRSPLEVFPAVEETAFGDALTRASEAGEQASTTDYFPPAEAWLSADFYPTESGVSIYFRDVTERRERERELETQRERLAALAHLNSVVQEIAASMAGESSREEIESRVTERLADSESFAFAWIGDVDDGEFVVREEAGVEAYLSELTLSLTEEPGRSGPTATAYRTSEVQTVHDVAADPDYAEWTDHAQSHGYRSSVAVPLVVDGESYGVLNVYSERRGAFAEEERETFSRLGTIVADAVRSTERRRRYQTLAENIPNGSVALVNDEFEYELAAGRLFDQFDVSPEAVVDSHVSELEFVSEAVRGRLRAQLRESFDGESTERELEVGDRVLSVRTVPIRDDDGDVTEVMSLSQDVTEAKRRRQALERERERLELLNRLLRHNFLNSLNVVDGRLSLLEEHVDPSARTHLETVQERTGDMIDLVESIRSLMRSLVGTESRRLEAVPADSIVETEVRAAREQFPDAEFTFEGDAGDVKADGLLNEVVENLLVNAVQHNDAETPRVQVGLESDAETVTIEVSDNGPGISEEVRSSVFESGERAFESPETGFGLHLVREIVKGFGGEVTVDGGDEGGATIRVRLPRA